ncbi:hypothetical protein Ccrd_017193 [Cynara cardunculus var. scolymus]|uniref:Uncharacterized protein n=1 Tax=Cynara cardunculus var. scolymus TaxID=59895 RepID=A0A103Y8K0_CYNCS|nr:hypothetical protein Ccrd_017193 [Cynara cardunculus var. scolymus]
MLAMLGMNTVEKADADLSVKSHQGNVVVAKDNNSSGKNDILPESIKTVKIGSGCEDDEKIPQVLLQVDGDVDAAIEFIIVDQGTEEYLVENDRVTFPVDTSHGNDNDQLIHFFSYAGYIYRVL